jgi:hypothetical protein
MSKIRLRVAQAFSFATIFLASSSYADVGVSYCAPPGSIDAQTTSWDCPADGAGGAAITFSIDSGNTPEKMVLCNTSENSCVPISYTIKCSSTDLQALLIDVGSQFKLKNAGGSSHDVYIKYINCLDTGSGMSQTSAVTDIKIEDCDTARLMGHVQSYWPG